MSGIDVNRRDFTACTSANCSDLKKSKVKAIFFRDCCNNVDTYFIIDVFKRYKRGEDYFSAYLDIGR